MQKAKKVHKRKVKKHRYIRLFFKAMIISLSVCCFLLIAGFTAYQAIAKPPALPDDGNDPTVLQIDNTISPSPAANDDSAYLPPDGDKADMLVGGGLKAPETFDASDRKPQFYTFLIFGLDEGINTDTIMVGSYDGVNKTGNIISIPRDSKVDVKRNVKKINAAYPAGTLYGGGNQGGVDQMKREIKTIIGFEPDYYVCINLKAFVNLVDSVGGVDVNVPFNMKYDDPAQNLHINIQSGTQHLDGAAALTFARYRKSNNGKNVISDYQRIDNQHTVIDAVMSKLLQPENILKIPDYIKIFNDNVSSDVKPENMLWFAGQLSQIKGTSALSMYTMPTTGTSGPPMYYEYLDEAGIVKLVNDTINPYNKDISAGDLDIAGAD